MDVKFVVRGTELNGNLKSYMEEKVEKLDKFFDRLIGSSINVNEVKGNYTVEVTANANGVILRAEAKGQDSRKAFDLALKNLERQIKKHNSYLKDKGHYRTDEPFSFSLDMDPGHQDASAEDNLGIVKTKKIVLHPMDPQEAIMQMDLLGHEFFMFQNGETGSINVIYRRHDGGYGLIEPAV